MWRTPSGPSTVTMFQVNATRSRQKQSSTNKPAAASMSLAVRTLSKSANQIFTAVPVGEVSICRSVVVSVIKALQVVGWRLVVSLNVPIIVRSRFRAQAPSRRSEAQLRAFTAEVLVYRRARADGLKQPVVWQAKR